VKEPGDGPGSFAQLLRNVRCKQQDERTSTVAKKLNEKKLNALQLAVEVFDVELDNDGQLVIYTGLYAEKLHEDDATAIGV